MQGVQQSWALGAEDAVRWPWGQKEEVVVPWLLLLPSPHPLPPPLPHCLPAPGARGRQQGPPLTQQWPSHHLFETGM